MKCDLPQHQTNLMPYDSVSEDFAIEFAYSLRTDIYFLLKITVCLNL